MGFNYGYEKKKFDSRWKRLEVEYCDAGMSEEQIAAMKEYDWAWFCSQRVFQNHTQPIPCEQYDEVCGQSQLFRKFASLSYQWDVDKIDQTRYGWLASVENEQLLLRLKKLSKKDLELLTLLFVDGYCDSFGFQQIPGFLPDNPLKSAEMTVEDDYGMIDGVINNGTKEPTVAQLEQQARSGQPISLIDLAAAAHREDRDKKKSVMDQLKSQPKPEHKKTAPKKSAEREI